MKPATKGAAVVVAAVVAGLAAWNFWDADETSTDSAGDEAVVQQPSGKVLNAGDDAQATAGQNGSGSDGDTIAQPQVDSQPQKDDSQVAAVDPKQPVTSDPDPANLSSDANNTAQGSDNTGDPQADQPKNEAADVADQPADKEPAQGSDNTDDAQTGEPKDDANADDATDPENATSSDDPQTTDQDQSAASDDQQDAEPQEPVDPLAPRFDIVRVDSEGQTVVAGKAPPGTDVEIVLDGVVVAEARADGNGGFVAILDIALTGDAQSLQLRAPRGDDDPATADAGTGSDRNDPEATSDQGTEADQQTAALDDKEPEVKTTGGALTGPNLVNGKVPPVGDAPSGDTAAGDAATLAATDTADDNVPAAPQITEGPSVPSVDVAVIQPGAISSDGVTVDADSAGSIAAGAQPQETAGTGFAPVSPVPNAPDEVEAGRYRLSAPVIILPSTGEGAAPTLVQPKAQELALLQPAGGDIRGVVLDRITYSDIGDVKLAGRGRSGRAIRIYGNGLLIGTTRVEQDGTWAMALASERGKEIRLFRFDEVDTTGGVSSRIETPFEYSSLSPKVVRERRVVIQRGDVLWRIAEQFYGEGVRYSYIYGANTELIRDPDLIYPGQVFSIPELVDAN